MNILQIHLELSDIPPKDTVRFEGETTSFEICVENSKNPIRFKAKQQNYCYKKNRYSKVELEPYQIVNMYRCENLHKGAQKIDKEDVERYSQEPGNLVYSQDEIYCNSDDLKCYNKVVLVRNDIVKNDNAIWRNNINFLSLSNLDLATRPGEFRFKYCKSYIAVYYMLTVTLWSGMKEVIQVPKEDKLPPFIDSKNEVHYRLRFKSIPFAR